MASQKISFDVIEAAGKAYIRLWEDRRYLFRMASLVMVLKILFMTVVFAVGWQENILRQTLLLAPAFLLEGWMLAHVVRLVLLEQRWPISLSGNPEHDAPVIAESARGILSAMILYMLVIMAKGAVFATLFYSQGRILESEPPQAPPEIAFDFENAMIYGISVFGFVVFILTFRLWWLYVPAAANYSLSGFIRTFSGFQIALTMIGGWLISYVPFIMVNAIVIALINVITLDENLRLFLILVSHIILDLIAVMVATMCIAYCIKEVREPPQT